MSPRSTTRSESGWRNWSGLESAVPVRTVDPTDAAAVAAEVERAREHGRTVKMVGTGHSFTGIAAPEHTMLRPVGLTGILAVDRDAMCVTAAAGTRLRDFNLALEALGLSLHNMGDIDEQTLAGAISTGTHGTGGYAASLSAQVVGLEMVTGTGEVVHATSSQNADVFEFARVGLGALGVITAITFGVEPLFLLEAVEVPMSWDQAVHGFDELVADHDHVDLYWFPHTDRLLSKRNSRRGEDLSAARSLPRWRAWLDDDLLANHAFGAVTAAANHFPLVIPRMNRLNARLLGPRRYVDLAHRVFTSERGVIFREMEYAVPREAGLHALAEVRSALEASDLTISFPIEIRVAHGDDIALSTAAERDSFYLAFHTHHQADHTAYFALMEPIMRAHGGRPHWGKVHTLGAAELASSYPRFDDFLVLRDRLDPDRVFANDYLRRVLGD